MSSAFPSSAAVPGLRCPFPGCENIIGAGSREVCACEYKLPLTRCAACSIWNAAHARYCRACQRPLALPDLSGGRVAVSAVDFIQAPGDYYYPLAVQQGLLWCLGADGNVVRLSPRGGAKPFLWSRLPSRAVGFNRVLAVSAMEAPPPLRGPLLIACDPAGIYGVSLLTGDVKPLHQATGSVEIVANSSVEESINFRGVAASGEMVCFLQRVRGAPEAKLAIRYFHPQRAAEDPITIPGTAFLTPVIAGDQIAVCSDEEVGIYDLRDQSRHSFVLPRDFRPFFARAWQTTIPHGSVPLAAGVSDEGRQVWIGGTQDGRQGGILRVAIDKQYADFTPLEKGSSISNAYPTGWSVNRVDRAEFFGVERPAGRIGDIQPGMPIAYGGGRLAYFSRSAKPGLHNLTLLAGEPLGLAFEDFECNENSCCGIMLCGAEIVVSYLNRGTPGISGLKFAHWHLSG